MTWTEENSITALPGGFLNRGRIFRRGDFVVRKQDHRWPRAVSEALSELAARDVDSCPQVIAQPNPMTVILTFMTGIEIADPVPEWAASLNVLLEMADFMRSFSDMSHKVREVVTYDDWLIPPPAVGSVFTHGDPHPTNIVFDEQKHPSALIDFELATVAPEDWNIASLLYTWAPLEPTPLTCWRNEANFDPTERFHAVLDRWQPRTTTMKFKENLDDYIAWRMRTFEELAGLGNQPARYFTNMPSYTARHQYASNFTRKNLHGSWYAFNRT